MKYARQAIDIGPALKKNIWPIVVNGRTKMDDRPFVRSVGRRNKKEKKERLHTRPWT